MPGSDTLCVWSLFCVICRMAVVTAPRISRMLYMSTQTCLCFDKMLSLHPHRRCEGAVTGWRGASLPSCHDTAITLTS